MVLRSWWYYNDAVVDCELDSQHLAKRDDAHFLDSLSLHGH